MNRIQAIEFKIAYPLREPPDDTWLALHGIAAKGEAGVRRRFLEAIAKTRDNLDVVAIGNALARGDIDGVMALIPMDDLRASLLEMETSLDDVRSRGFDLGRSVAEPHLDVEQLAIHLGARTELAIAWRHVSADVLHAIRTNAATRVQGITEQTQLAIRNVLERQYTEGVHPRQMIPAMRETIGLRVSQEAALERYRAALIADDKKIPPARIEQLVAKRRKQMLTERARVIARHESIQAANDGQRASWITLVERGLLNESGGGGMEREWMAIVPNDGRTCVICEALDGARAPIRGMYGSVGGKGPQAHVECRCTERLVPINA